MKGYQGKLAQNQERLQEITNLLLAKNKQLMDMEKAFLQRRNISLSGRDTQQKDPLDGLLNFRILAEDDWMTFKNHFERSYPGYLSCLRMTFSDITQAEERLFLLYNLNLNRQEIAKILGVSEATVKKSRTRLQKRLGLGLATKQNLEQFIQDFK